MNYYLTVITFATIFTILSQSYNLILGYAGQFHLGHVAFFGIGAYTFGILTVKAGFPIIPAMVAAGLIAGIFGVFLGKISLPFKSHYLVIVTYGFNEIIKSIELNWSELTNGALGILGVPRPEIFGYTLNDSLSFLLFVILVAALCHYIIYRIIKSPYGLLLEAVREDEIATETIGRNTVRTKIEAMTVSAIFAGVAGALFAMQLSIVVPEDYGLNTVIFVLLMLLLGGRGSFWGGGIIGPFLLYMIFEPLRFLNLPESILGSLRMLIYAILFISIMLYRPQGILGRKAIHLKCIKEDRT
ncbi:MAG: branched-chain amino acid ABC transporter permease [Candidatus Peregrinibacteria bacterium]|nr:branched-chain amino acid ABC transporter permease [Candidatus Peregrinibacteria bacterium]MDZ4244853.1 branched-chain amino acid ABC transporter permease [Candidatus Gracilibacteria bacterium]